MDETNTQNAHCVESVQIRSYLLSTISWALFYGFICMMEKVNFGYSIKNIPNLPKEHPDTFRNNILITVNEKSQDGNRKNEMDSNTFQQQRQYRQLEPEVI